MCGIVGLCGGYDSSWLAQMKALVAHRGPDGSGEYHDPDGRVTLAMQRLSILDIDGGSQPMNNALCASARGHREPTAWIVYNGEVYNSPVLRRTLEKREHVFATSHSDTELLLHLYEDKREAMLSDVNGMFAFVIYDRERRLLFGARDRVGIKPLYYVDRPDLFAFASEMKSFLAIPSLSRTLDHASLFHYTTLLYIPGEQSIFQDVRSVPPGHWFVFDLKTRRLTLQAYWDLDVTHAERRSEDEWVELIREGLRESVKRHTLSDVPIGCSLSGGVDSSAIVGLLGEAGHGKIRTYSVGFAGEGEESWNELPLARKTAGRWATEHHEVVLEPDRLLDDLVEMVWHLDEPYAGGLPSWYVFQFMRQDVKVGLTGTGGDEDFGDYGRYRFFETSRIAKTILAHRAQYEAASRRLRWLWRPWARLAEAVPDSWLGQARKRRVADALNFAGGPIGRYHCNAWYYFSDEAKRAAVFSMIRNGIPDTADLLQHWFDASGASDARDGIAYLDFKTQLPDEFLMMTDRLSMAHSLEARVPFLDHTFVELVFRIPSDVRSRRTDLKYLLKRAVGDLLPADVLKAGKRGFVIPITLWLRGPLKPLAERLLAPERLREQCIYDPRFFARYVRPHLEGRADYTWQVWAALMFQLWHVVFLERRTLDVPSWTWRDLL